MGNLVRRALTWLLRTTAVALSPLRFVAAIVRTCRAAFHTVLFVTETLDSPVKPQSWCTDDPLREKAHIPTGDGTILADMYRLPDGRPRAAVLLSLGVNDTGLDDPAVVNLGYALARTGYVVMVYWSPAMGIRANVDPAEPGILVRAFQHLEARDYVDPERVGLGGFCVGASLALVAAADVRIRERVHFVNAFGPYFDLKSLILQAASRSVHYEDQREPWEPDSVTLRVIANELIKTLDNSTDADVLTRHFSRNASATESELAALSPAGRTVLALLNGVDTGEADALFSTLPSTFRYGLSGVSPVHHVENLRASLLVMHDRFDNIVPVNESRRLVNAVEDELDVRYTEFQSFDHMRPGPGSLPTRLAQAFRLYLHMYNIIRMAS